MALHDAFEPTQPPRHWRPALPSVEQGVQRIIEAVSAHRDAPNAALQMAHALADLMAKWATSPPHVTASDLMETSLARAMMHRMIRDPHVCAELYNHAVRAVPEAGMRELRIDPVYVELPLWRLRDDGRRMPAYDNDVERALDEPGSAPRLMPRALFMTALVRMGMCDLFIHGTGGAKYDRAMEHWIDNWLGVNVGNVAVTSATLRLPLEIDQPPDIERDEAIRRYRRAWHDPQAAATDHSSPGETKRRWLEYINSLPYGSSRRRAAYYEMHEALERMRHEHQHLLDHQREQIERIKRYTEQAPIAQARTWPFPLYPDKRIDALAELVNARVNETHGATTSCARLT